MVVDAETMRVLDPNPLNWGLHIYDKNGKRSLFRFSRKVNREGVLVGLDIKPVNGRAVDKHGNELEDGRIKIRKRKGKKVAEMVVESRGPKTPPVSHPMTGSTPKSMGGFRPPRNGQKIGHRPCKLKDGDGVLRRDEKRTTSAWKSDQKKFFKDFYDLSSAPKQQAFPAPSATVDATITDWAENENIWRHSGFLPELGVEKVELIRSLPADHYRREAGFPELLREQDSHRQRNKLRVSGWNRTSPINQTERNPIPNQYCYMFKKQKDGTEVLTRCNDEISVKAWESALPTHRTTDWDVFKRYLQVKLNTIKPLCGERLQLSIKSTLLTTLPCRPPNRLPGYAVPWVSNHNLPRAID